jgi:hypothetical protein
MKWILTLLMICCGCQSQGQLNWRGVNPPTYSDSLGNPGDAYIVGMTNNVIWRRFPVSLLATNITAGLEWPYTSITNAPWLTNNQSGVNFYDHTVSNSNPFSVALFVSGAQGAGGALVVGNGGINIWDGRLVFSKSQADRLIDMTSSTNVYEDIVFPLTTLNPPGLESPAVLISTNGPSGDQMALYTSANDVLFVVAQMPHTWTAGTRIYPHIHHTPASANPVTNVWRIAYTMSDINGTLPSSTVVTNRVITPAGQWAHRLNDVPTNGIDMAATVGPSTIISLKYTLLSTSEPLRIKSYDVHYRWGGSPVVFNP